MTKKESGFVLISSYILIAGLLTAVLSYFSRSFYDFDLAQRRLGRLQALYTAESGAERALDWIKASPPTLLPDCGGADPDTETPYSNTNLGTEGTYTVNITTDCANPNQIYWIRSTGTFDNVTREVRMSVRFTNFANYALASDHMYPDTYFSSVAIYGPLHINGPIQIWGWPQFHGRVTSSASELVFFNNFNNQDGIPSDPRYRIWQGDPPYPLLNQPRILLPPADVSSLDRAGVQKITRKMWIEFNREGEPAGTYNYSHSGPITAQNRGTNVPMPVSGTTMFFHANDIRSGQPAVVIGGVLDRALTIASPQDIGIDGNLRYNCFRGNGLSDCGPTDPKLTVVSSKNIVNLPNARTDQIILDRDRRDNEIRTGFRYLNGAFIALGGGMTVFDPNGLNRELKGLRIFGSVIEHEIKSVLTLAEERLGDPSSRPEIESGGHEGNAIVHDPRLDLASLPNSMRQALSILSWEACDGPCS